MEVGMGLGSLLMVLLCGALIVLAVWLIRALFPPLRRPSTKQDLSARDILDRRFTRGEISQEEYDLMIETLLQ
jgi:uncharacterized membrane protein